MLCTYGSYCKGSKYRYNKNELMNRAKDAVPELLKLNSQKPAKVISYVCNRTQTMAYA